MSRVLFIRLPSNAQLPIRWLLYDGKPVDQGDVGLDSLPRLASLSRQHHTVLVIPGEQATYHKVPLAGRSRLALKAVPYQLEEHLSSPLSDLHIALIRPEKGVVGACVMSRSQLQSHIEQMQESGVELNAICPDYLLLPDAELAGFVEDQRVLVRGGDTGCNLSVEMFSVWWSLCNYESIAIYGELGTASEGIAQGKPSVEDLLLMMANEYHPRRTLNLLQGEYRIQTQLSKTPKVLEGAAVLMVLCSLVYALILFASNQLLVREVAYLKSEIRTEYATAFPESRSFVKVKLRMQRELDQLLQRVNQRSLLSELARVNAVLVQADMQAIALEYMQSPFNLILQLRSPEKAAFDRLLSALSRNGIEAQVVELGPEGDDYLARLTIGVQK